MGVIEREQKIFKFYKFYKENNIDDSWERDITELLLAEKISNNRTLLSYGTQTNIANIVHYITLYGYLKVFPKDKVLRNYMEASVRGNDNFYNFVLYHF